MTNLAAVYGVTIEHAVATPAWHAISVRRLSAKENGSSHNVFVKVLQPNGDRDRNPVLRIGWTWEGRRSDEGAPTVKLDKGDANERGHGDVPIAGMSQKIAVWIEGDGLTSDIVRGMHTNFPDEAPGNTRGHYSYEVIFQRGASVMQPPPDKPTSDPVDFALLFANVDAMRKQLDEHEALLRSMQGDL